MKIRMEIDENIIEDELVIRCGSLSDDIIILQKQIMEAMNTKMQLHVMKQKSEYLLTLGEILFLETADSFVAVHTAKDIFETKPEIV